MYIGSHISISKGFADAAKTAVSMGANTFQFFTRNPRGAKAKNLDPKDIENLIDIMKEYNFGPLLAHAPYTLNLASYKEHVYDFAKQTFKDDIKRLEQTPCNLYNFHPGNHTGKGIKYGIKRIADIINGTLTGNEKTMILLETMSGKGTEIGYTFEQLKSIIDKIKYSELMGVCLDTCHVYSAGYDIVNKLDNVLQEFDDILGIEKLRAIHLNDSMKEFNSRKDRHAVIGEGIIGLEAIISIINHPQLTNIPFLLETPNDVAGHAEEIKLLKENKI